MFSFIQRQRLGQWEDGALKGHDSRFKKKNEVYFYIWKCKIKELSKKASLRKILDSVVQILI